MVDLETPPIDAAVREPTEARLEQLAGKLWKCTYDALDGPARAKVHELGLLEMQVSALSVIAQFCMGHR